MLDVDPKKRPTALELSKHPWFTNMDSLPNSKLSNIQDHNLVRVCEFYFLMGEKKFIYDFYFSIILMLHLMLSMQIQIKV
jgi:serine/threonine protein kinase